MNPAPTEPAPKPKLRTRAEREEVLKAYRLSSLGLTDEHARTIATVLPETLRGSTLHADLAQFLRSRAFECEDANHALSTMFLSGNDIIEERNAAWKERDEALRENQLLRHAIRLLTYRPVGELSLVESSPTVEGAQS